MNLFTALTAKNPVNEEVRQMRREATVKALEALDRLISAYPSEAPQTKGTGNPNDRESGNNH